VSFVAKRQNEDNDLGYVRLRVADSDRLPSSTVIEEVELYESALAVDWAWTEISFSNAGGLSPDEGLCLVLEHSGVGGPSAVIRYEGGVSPGRLYTDTAGTAWQYFADSALHHFVHGTVSTPGQPQTATHDYATGVFIRLQLGDDPAGRVVTGTRTLNTPKLLSRFWEADFDDDPRLDHNGDGLSDWVVGAGTFDPASLVDGVWQADSTLETHPDNDFAGLTSVDLRFRNTSLGGEGAAFRINADQSAGSYAPITVYAQKQPDGTQTLSVYNTDGLPSSSTDVALLTVRTLSSGFIDLRLLMDPELDTVSITVNGVHRETYAYSTFVPTVEGGFAAMWTDGSAAEFDYVCVRVSE
jgi:hypothetical protein